MEDIEDLFAAIEKAIGRGLTRETPGDCRIVQDGCYLLNKWGYGPFYTYDSFVRGPCSIKLIGDFRNRKGAGDSGRIPDDAIRRLSEITGRGQEYLEAYSSLLLMIELCPGASMDLVVKRLQEISPRISDQITEASASIS